MESFAIRVPSVEYLFDSYSVEPLERKPLEREVRERILKAWIDTREKRPKSLTVQLPAGLEREGLAQRLREGIRHDLKASYEASRHLKIFTRAERREANVAFVFLVVCLLLSGLIDKSTENDALFTSISQGLVVLGWVALWTPAQQVFAAVARRLNKKRYRELAQVEIEIVWS